MINTEANIFFERRPPALAVVVLDPGPGPGVEAATFPLLPSASRNLSAGSSQNDPPATLMAPGFSFCLEMSTVLSFF